MQLENNQTFLFIFPVLNKLILEKLIESQTKRPHCIMSCLHMFGSSFYKEFGLLLPHDWPLVIKGTGVHVKIDVKTNLISKLW